MFGTAMPGTGDMLRIYRDLDRRIADTVSGAASPRRGPPRRAYGLSGLGHEVRALRTAASSLLHGRGAVGAALATARSASSLLDTFTDAVRRLHGDRRPGGDAEAASRLARDFRDQFAVLMREGARGGGGALLRGASGLSLLAGAGGSTLRVDGTDIEGAVLSRLGEALSAFEASLRAGGAAPPPPSVPAATEGQAPPPPAAEGQAPPGGTGSPPAPGTPAPGRPAPGAPDAADPPRRGNGQRRGWTGVAAPGRSAPHRRAADVGDDNALARFGVPTAPAPTAAPSPAQTAPSPAPTAPSAAPSAAPSPAPGGGTDAAGAVDARDRAFRSLIGALDGMRAGVASTVSRFETDLSRIDVQHGFVTDVIGIHNGLDDALRRDADADLLGRLSRLVEMRDAAMAALLPTLAAPSPVAVLFGAAAGASGPFPGTAGRFYDATA